MDKEYMISGFSDEMTTDIVEQFELLARMGISYFEPRTINDKNIIALTDNEADELLALMKKYGIKASSIGSPIGKIKVDDDFEPHFEEFKRTVQIAKKLGTRYIRMFSFYLDEDKADSYEEDVVTKLKRFVEYAEKENVILLHENEKGIYGNIGIRCKILFDRIKSPNFKAVFDFSNFIECSEDTLNAYNMIKDNIEYIHIKDNKRGVGVVPPGKGDGNLKVILTDLFKRGYKGFLSIEPHLYGYTLPDEKTLGEFVTSFDGDLARKFTYAKKNLLELLQQI